MKPKINTILIVVVMLWLATFVPSRVSKASTAYKLFTVNSTVDNSDARIDGICNDGSGKCTLRAAIEEASATPDPDEIIVPAGTYVLSAGQLSIDTPVTITGSGNATTIIDGAGLSRIFRLSAATTFTLNGVTLNRGNAGAGDGGAIHVMAKDARLFLNNSIIQNSTAANGGAIFLVNGTATLNNSTITRNGAHRGGGIYAVDGSLFITGSIISGNMAVDPEYPVGWGGGIYVIDAVARVTINITGTQIMGNSAGGFYGGLNIAVSNAANVSLVDVTVTDNIAGNAAGGGQVFNEGPATVTIQNSRFENNYAGSEGGLAVRNVTLENVIIQNNTSETGAGGLTTHGNVAVKNSTILNNVAHSTASEPAFNVAGGIRNPGNLSLIDSTITGNKVTGGTGGGIFNDAEATLQITGNTLSGNQALEGGAIYNRGVASVQHSCIINNTPLSVVNTNPQPLNATNNWWGSSDGRPEVSQNVNHAPQLIEGILNCTNKPVLVLGGNNPLVVEAGNTYADPGATASDTEDGDITGLIQVDDSAVNTASLGSYQVLYSVTDSSGEIATASRTVNVVDMTPPVITLNGDAEVTVEAGNPYTDPGATANDSYAGDLTGNVVVSGSVDISVAGTYTLTYSVSDSSGNPATPVTRTVRVISSNIPPVASAGQDSAYIDSDGDGLEAVPLDGAGSTDSDGSIMSYSWALNGAEIATGVNPVVNLLPGTHEIALTVTDDDGSVHSDTVIITVTGSTGSACAIGAMTVEGISNGQKLTGVVNVQAIFTGPNAPSQVDFALTGPDGSPYTHSEENAPYYFLGDENGIPYGWNINIYPAGNYTLTITAYQEQSACASQTFNLQVQQPSLPDLPEVCAHIAITNVIYGTNKSERLTGTAANDLILAGKGSDTVYGGDGDDCILGGNSNDRLYGGQGNDVLLGEAGRDILYGDVGQDTLLGGNSYDRLYGGDGNDYIAGEAGYDVLFGDSGQDTIYGGDGRDDLYGGSGDDTLYGETGYDDLYGDTGDDTLTGGLQGDNFYGGAGFDTVTDYEPRRDYKCFSSESGCQR